MREAYQDVKYLMTVCTGAGIAARAGILDGKNATTNKAAWNETTALGPNVKWISHARWVVDGNIWTTSGVSGKLSFYALSPCRCTRCVRSVKLMS